MNQVLLCLGAGYCARRLAPALLERGWAVRGTCRQEDKRADLEGEGLRVWVFDANQPLPAEAFQGVTHILSSVPPDAVGDPVLRSCGPSLLSSGLAWVGYLSSTGVYGDHAGEWVDERTPPGPIDSEQSRRRAVAEEEWRSLADIDGLPVHVFRLAGIYGPGRNPLDRVRAGRARRFAAPEIVLNRIHVDDIVQTLEASLAAPRPGAIYNLADDLPEAQEVVVSYACELLGVEPPVLESVDDASPMLQGFLADSKRVKNDLIKRELGVELRYPDYRMGLQALLNA